MKYYGWIFLIALVVAGMCLGGNVEAAQKTVLVIQSYALDLPWTKQCDQGIFSVLGGVASLEHVYLDTKKIPVSEFGGRATLAMETFRRVHPDLVMIGDDDALRLLGPQIAASGKPVVFFGINNNPRNYFESIPPNVTGVLENVPLLTWIRHLKRIIPRAKSALVLLDGSITAKGLISGNFGAKDHIVIEGITLRYKHAVNWAEWQKVILNVHSYDFITTPVYHSLRTDAGVYMPVEKVLRWTSETSPVPVFAYQDYAVSDTGVVGSYVIFGETHGRFAAQLAKLILENKVHPLPPIQSDQEGRFYFNKKQLNRFGLVLPKDIEEQVVYR